MPPNHVRLRRSSALISEEPLTEGSGSLQKPSGDWKSTDWVYLVAGPVNGSLYCVCQKPHFPDFIRHMFSFSDSHSSPLKAQRAVYWLHSVPISGFPRPCFRQISRIPRFPVSYSNTPTTTLGAQSFHMNLLHLHLSKSFKSDPSLRPKAATRELI